MVYNIYISIYNKLGGFGVFGIAVNIFKRWDYIMPFNYDSSWTYLI